MDFFSPSVTLSPGAKVLFLFGGGGNGDGACIVYCIGFEHSHQSGNACLGFEIRREWASSVGLAGPHRGKLGAPQGQQINLGKISRQLAREEWLQNMAICNRQIS